MDQYLKNYTSKVDASISIGKIERTLMRMGANRIIKDYDRDLDCVSSIMFEIDMGGVNTVFKLPSKVDRCFSVINRKRKRKTDDGAKRDMEQAERTAWKILYEWVEVQAALIFLDQADFQEIFLPYAYNPILEKTLYEIASENGIGKLLLIG